MELGLRGKAAAITGASKGIGRAAALALAREGVAVALCARDAAALEATCRAIAAETGERAIAIPADMSRAEEAQRFIDQAAERLGRLDILVNSVGAAPPGGLLDLPDEAWVTAFNLKFMGAVRATRAAVPHLRRAGGGVVINIAGTAGKEPAPRMMTAGFNNAAMMNFTKALALAHGAEGIRAVVICPGYVRTQRWERLRQDLARTLGVSEEEAQRRVEQEIPLGRIAEPEDVANLIVFLASEAARHLTGVQVTIDGGQTRAL